VGIPVIITPTALAKIVALVSASQLINCFAEAIEPIAVGIGFPSTIKRNSLGTSSAVFSVKQSVDSLGREGTVAEYYEDSQSVSPKMQLSIFQRSKADEMDVSVVSTVAVTIYPTDKSMRIKLAAKYIDLPVTLLPGRHRLIMQK